MMVTFGTNVYEGDWRFILCTNYLDEMVRRCNCMFHYKRLFINNVDNPQQVKKAAEKKVEKGVIDQVCMVDDYRDEVLRHFNLTMEEFKGGYPYSIANLTSIYLCETDYMLYFTGDALMVETDIDWISKAISSLEQDANFIVANPCWNRKYADAAAESLHELDDFYVGYGFSDQCYLIRAEQFKKDIYHESHPASARYPKYAGELFEKRVDSYMRNHGLLRLTSKETSYLHKDFPKTFLKKAIAGLFKNHYVRRRFER